MGRFANVCSMNMYEQEVFSVMLSNSLIVEGKGGEGRVEKMRGEGREARREVLLLSLFIKKFAYVLSILNFAFDFILQFSKLIQHFAENKFERKRI